jgi:hypothetical protein
LLTEPYKLFILYSPKAFSTGKVIKANKVINAYKIIPASNNCGNLSINKIPPNNIHVTHFDAKLTTGTSAERILRGA